MAFMEPTAAEPDRPKNLLALLHALLQDPGMATLRDSAEANMTEQAMVAFGNMLLDNVMAFPTEPGAFAVKYHRDLEVKVTAVDKDGVTVVAGVIRLWISEKKARG